MCAEAVPMVARVHDNRLIHQAELLQRADDRGDAGSTSVTQAEVSPFDTRDILPE